MKNTKKYLLSLTFICLGASVFAQPGGGNTALPFLKMDMGARYYGMAGAATAFGDDVTAANFYNPAALGRVRSFQVAGNTFDSSLDMKYNHVGLAFPVKFLSLSGGGPLVIGGNFYSFDKGDIELDEFNTVRPIGSDMAFTLSIGENIGNHTWSFMGDTSDVSHFFGVNGKYIRSTLPAVTKGDVTASAFAFDAGYTITVDEHFGLGIAMKNMGNQIKYINESDSLPLTASIGLFFTLFDVPGLRWDLSGDYIRHIKEREDRVRVGTEAAFLGILVVRGGIRLFEEIDKEYTLGFGLRLLGLEVDFGTVLNPQFNSDKVYQIGVAYKFPVSKKNDAYDSDEKKRRDYEDYKRKEADAAADRAQQNKSPLLYQ